MPTVTRVFVPRNCLKDNPDSAVYELESCEVSTKRVNEDDVVLVTDSNCLEFSWYDPEDDVIFLRFEGDQIYYLGSVG